MDPGRHRASGFALLSGLCRVSGAVGDWTDEDAEVTRQEWAGIEAKIPGWRKHYSFRERTIILYVYRLFGGHEGFYGLVRFCEDRLAEFYPSTVFDGSSGDSGPVFVVALRTAIANLRATSPGAS